MDEERKFTRRVDDGGFQAADISGHEPDGRIGREVRRTAAEPVRVARENGQVRVQIERAVHVGETFQHPRPEESRAAGQEDGLTTQGFPQVRGGVRPEMFEVIPQRIAPARHHRPRQNSRIVSTMKPSISWLRPG